MAVGPGSLLGDGLIPDRFRVRQRLGRGAAGQVLLAWDRFFERDVALKLLDFGGAQTPGPEALAASLHEARALARLRHPNVVGVYELVHRVSPPILVMEYVIGEELEQILQRAAGPLPLAQVIAVGRALGAALARAHQAGMLHRDVKPANVMVADDGTIKLIDFGLAGVAPVDPQLIGTPAYCAPEVLEGALPDARADLFSVGVILYRMLTLQHPFPARDLDELRAALRRPPPDPRSVQPAISVWLAELVQRCLAPHPQLPPRRMRRCRCRCRLSASLSALVV
jgi:serine/threonine-protein kinase